MISSDFVISSGITSTILISYNSNTNPNTDIYDRINMVQILEIRADLQKY